MTRQYFIPANRSNDPKSFTKYFFPEKRFPVAIDFRHLKKEGGGGGGRPFATTLKRRVAAV